MEKFHSPRFVEVSCFPTRLYKLASTAPTQRLFLLRLFCVFEFSPDITTVDIRGIFATETETDVPTFSIRVHAGLWRIQSRKYRIHIRSRVRLLEYFRFLGYVKYPLRTCHILYRGIVFVVYWIIFEALCIFIACSFVDVIKSPLNAVVCILDTFSCEYFIVNNYVINFDYNR